MKLESPVAASPGPDAFGPLIDATCELAGVAPADAWLDLGVKHYRSATFVVDGVECIVSHRLMDPDALFIHCVFGPVPEARSTDALLALMQLNVTLFGNRSPVFGADTERNLLLCVEHRVQDLRAADLARTLENLATQAIGWRKVWGSHA